MEFTLEDALENLKDTRAERQKQLDDLKDLLSNNEAVSLVHTTGLEDIKNKQHQLYNHLLHHVSLEEPKDYAIPKTRDIHVEVLANLEAGVQDAQKLLDKMKAHLSEIEDDISYLENKKLGLEKMKDAYLGAAKMKAKTTYDKENVTAKRIFKSHSLIEFLFPKEPELKNYLGDLVLGYVKGGDDVYVDVTSEVLDFVNFLIEADIATYHRNDKSKVKLTDIF
ncbi:uncharacterized protein LOC100883389 isoform X2 [Megachile rotundata]|uniref:uncharacterized protein LOC100883389 isoform X2 n=1 Tax=Megachile rotundata TaxID=143995 RepID=UPI0006151A7B|nr:PREDICTED: uncharacterized protein LOC100883389 isoform X2 [Megachile rotundata]